MIAPPVTEFCTVPCNAPQVHTFGWDTVSVARLADVNAAIVAAKSSPAAFKATARGAVVDGVFGDWRLGARSNDDFVQMFLPMRRIAIYRDQFSRPDLWDAAGTAEVSLPLKFVPHTSTADGLIDTYNLIISAEGEKIRAPAKVVRIIFDGQQPHALQKAIIKVALEDWLNENMGAFAHVFAAVSVHKAAPEGGFPWLKPTYCSYAFGLNEEDPADSTFAILCQTGGRSAKGLKRRTPARAIPKGAQTAFLISKRRFLRDMVAPAIVHAFKGVRRSQLKISKNDEHIEFKGKAQLAPVRHKKKTYKPVLEALYVSLHNQDFRLETTTRTRVSPGIYSMCETGASYNFGIKKNKKGRKTLAFREARKPSNKHWTEKSKAVVIGEILLLIIGAVAMLTLEVVTLGAATVPAIILGGIIVGAFGGALSIKLIGAIAKGDGPPLDLLVANATDAVSWAHGAKFDPTYAALNGALQIGGVFTETAGRDGQARCREAGAKEPSRARAGRHAPPAKAVAPPT